MSEDGSCYCLGDSTNLPIQEAVGLTLGQRANRGEVEERSLIFLTLFRTAIETVQLFFAGWQVTEARIFVQRL